jgi:hypothetical protein
MQTKAFNVTRFNGQRAIERPGAPFQAPVFSVLSHLMGFEITAMSAHLRTQSDSSSLQTKEEKV